MIRSLTLYSTVLCGHLLGNCYAQTLAIRGTSFPKLAVLESFSLKKLF